MITVYGKEGCPKCFIIETKLKKLNKEFQVVHDGSKVVDFLNKNKIGDNLPITDNDGIIMSFVEMNKWINKIMGE